MRKVLAVMTALISLPAFAQESLPDLKEHLNAAKADVSSTGSFTMLPGGEVRFQPKGKTSGNSYIVEFALKRDDLKNVKENCVTTRETIAAQSKPCYIDIKAELSFDGSRANLIVFEVGDIERPTK